jgi:Tfp pilus assembly protein PilZ
MDERRRTRRFKTRLSIVSTDEQGLNFSFVTDLSRDGAYIETEKLIPIGTPFMFVLNNRSIQAPVNTRVIRMRDAFFEGGKSGIGVRFDRLEGLAKVVRDDLLLYFMNEPFHEQWQAA